MLHLQVEWTILCRTLPLIYCSKILSYLSALKEEEKLRRDSREKKKIKHFNVHFTLQRKIKCRQMLSSLILKKWK
jgi:hypothetical protein